MRVVSLIRTGGLIYIVGLSCAQAQSAMRPQTSSPHAVWAQDAIPADRSSGESPSGNSASSRIAHGSRRAEAAWLRRTNPGASDNPLR
jgi:hypothetical protein